MPFSTATPAQTAHRIPGSPAIPRFGAKTHPFSPTLFQPVFEQFDCFRQYGTVDAKSAYDQLSKGSRHHLDRLQEKISPADLKEIKDRKLLGKVEEAADVIFELYTLQIMRHGILPRRELDDWARRLHEMQEKNVPFHAVFTQLRDRLTPEQVRHFQAVSYLDEKRARNFLALIGVKFLLFTPKNKDFDTIPDARRRMNSEARELTEDLPFYSPRRLLVRLGSWFSARFPDVPGRWIQDVPEWYASKTLDCPVTYRDMMRYVFIKQMGRQELHYEKPDLTYKQRKCILKPFETLVEAAILKEALERKQEAQKPASLADRAANSAFDLNPATRYK